MSGNEIQSGNADRFAPLADRSETLAVLSDFIAGAWDSFDRPRPVEPGLDEALSERLALPLPELPTPARDALADATTILDESVSPSRPLFLAYIGSTGLEVGVLAAALTATYDVNLAVTARAADLVEKQTLEWVGEFIGFPADEGAFTSGGMTSNLTALLVARERALPGCRERGFDGRRGAIYCSDESHHSIVRAAEAAGLGSAAVRRLPIDEHRRMTVSELGPAIERDLAAGVVPVAVVATAGTTLTGAVDPIGAIAEVCEEHGVWLHVDGAYGLPAAATTEAATLFAGHRARRLGHPRRAQVDGGAEELQRGPGARGGLPRGHVRPRGVLHAPGGDPQRRRAHPRVLPAAALAEALARLPGPRRRSLSALDRGRHRPRRPAGGVCSRTTPTSSCCTIRLSRRSASATSAARPVTSTRTTPRSQPRPRRTGASTWPRPWSMA